MDVLYVPGFGLPPLTLLEEARREREETGFFLQIHVVQPRELIFIPNAAYVTHVLHCCEPALHTCLVLAVTLRDKMLQLVNHEIMEGCSKLRHPRGLDRVEGQFKVSKPVLYLYKDILT